MRDVAVIFGGPSREHDVSVASGREVLAALETTPYRAFPVLIERGGAWRVNDRRYADALDGARALRDGGCDVCFLALHGPFGEDGTIQGFLETAGLVYTGSGPAGSALAADKTRAKRFLQAFGIEGAPDLVAPPATAADVEAAFGFPAVVKNPFEGSTLGLEIVRNAAEYDDAVARLGADCAELLVERREVGREITASVLDDAEGRGVCLPLVEIVARNGFFDYDEKYSDDGAQKICPAALAPATELRIREAALTVHRALGLRGLSRTDFIVRPDDTVVFLETNTIPGLTAASLLPFAARATGMSFADVLARVIECACHAMAPTG